MAQSNVIVNGGFNLGDTGWTGTDLETSYNEGAYLGNGSANKVAEMDGYSSQTTIMQQTVTINNPMETELTFQSALRTASQPNAGSEGFHVEILDDQGQVVSAQTYLPTLTTWTTYSMPVSFPDAGTYTIRLTEIGPDNSLGAIIDNISMLVCYTAGSLIDTSAGPRAVESLSIGDQIWTKDAGFQPLLWIGQRRVELAELISRPFLRPVVFAPGSLGEGLPVRRMAVSPQHRVLRSGWPAELYFGRNEVLVPAHALINDKTIVQAKPITSVTYVHFLLNGHHIVRSDGVLSESFMPSDLALTGLDRAARAELLCLFPDLVSMNRVFPSTARHVLRPHEGRLLAY